MMDLRPVIAAGLVAIGLACTGVPNGDDTPAATAAPAATASVPRAELSLARDTAVVLDSADALIARDSSVGLVSVDEANRPRVRSVRAFRLENPTSTRERFSTVPTIGLFFSCSRPRVRCSSRV